MKTFARKISLLPVHPHGAAFRNIGEN